MNALSVCVCVFVSVCVLAYVCRCVCGCIHVCILIGHIVSLSGYGVDAYTILSFLLHLACTCAQVVMCCESVLIVQCREEEMPFSCVQ